VSDSRYVQVANEQVLQRTVTYMTYCLQFLSRHVYADFRRPSTEMTRLSSSVDFIVRERKEKAVYLGNKFDITGV